MSGAYSFTKLRDIMRSHHILIYSLNMSMFIRCTSVIMVRWETQCSVCTYSKWTKQSLKANNLPFWFFCIWVTRVTQEIVSVLHQSDIWYQYPKTVFRQLLYVGKYAGMHSKSVTYNDAVYVGSKWQDCSLVLKRIHVIVFMHVHWLPIYFWSIILTLQNKTIPLFLLFAYGAEHILTAVFLGNTDVVRDTLLCRVTLEVGLIRDYLPHLSRALVVEVLLIFFYILSVV